VQSALTGHLVLSSLHGTDSVAALHRFLDMGIESFLIASSWWRWSVSACLRRICDACKSRTSRTTQQWLSGSRKAAARRRRSGTALGARSAPARATAIASASTSCCRISPELRRLIVGWATQEELRRLAVSQGMRTLVQEAIALVDSDVTTIEEVIRTLYAS
jgi:type IV pilus assembly protein PilB